MTDRELLELAAKAAGIGIAGWTDCGTIEREGGGWFNSLDDEVDAFRLAIKLDIAVEPRSDCAEAWASYMDRDLTIRRIVEPYNKPEDEYAVCRAITRAAAAIGEQK